MRRLVFDTDEAEREFAGLSPREIGVLVVVLNAHAAGRPVDWVSLMQHDTEGWIRFALRQLHRKGKVVWDEEGRIEPAERRYRHQLRSGEPV